MAPEQEFLREIDSGNLLSVLPYYRDFLLEGGREGESLAWDLIGEKRWEPWEDLCLAFPGTNPLLWQEEGGQPHLVWTWYNSYWAVGREDTRGLLPDHLYELIGYWKGHTPPFRYNYSEWPTRLRAFQELVRAIGRSRT